MFLTIEDLLGADGLGEVHELLPTLSWHDGARTAGSLARAVKRNSQADLSSRTGLRLQDLLGAAIEGHPVLRAAAQPGRFSRRLVSRTEAGGGYGLHVDNAFMGEGPARLRTDLSYTLFLSAPGDYTGGELVIEHAGLTQALKPDAGTLVLYPSTQLHAVRPVTDGTRFACVGWIESHVPAAADREILFDLENLRASLARTHDAQSPEMLTLAKTISNLLRRFN